MNRIELKSSLNSSKNGASFLENSLLVDGNGVLVKFKYHPPECHNHVAWVITKEIR